MNEKEKYALIIIDPQNDTYRDEGYYAKKGVDISHIKRTVPAIQRLVAAFRKLRLPIIYTRHLFRDEVDAGLLLTFRPFLKEGGYRVNTWGGDIIDELKPERGDWIVDKSRYSAFYNSDLELILRGLKVDTLVFSGQSTNMCVDSTIHDAFYRDYKIVAVSDACGMHTNLDLHDSILKNISQGFGEVLTTAEMIGRLERSSGKKLE